MTTPADSSQPVSPSSAIAAVAAQINAPPLPFDPCTLVKGVITATNLTNTPPDVSLTVSGSSTVINNVRYLDSYSPVVGDIVQVLQQSSAIFVLGQVNITTTTGATLNGWTAFPTLGSGFTAAGSLYRLVVDNGDTKLQCQGSINISGTPTAVCTMPVGARPSTARQLSVGTSSAPGTLVFNTNGTVVWQPTTGGGTITGTSGSVGTHIHGIFYSLNGFLSQAGSNLQHSHIGNGGTDSGGGGTDVAGSHSHTAGTFASPAVASPTFLSLDGIEFFL